MKHIKIKHLVVRDNIKEEQTITDARIANLLTKALTPKLFSECVISMDVLISFDVFGSWEQCL